MDRKLKTVESCVGANKKHSSAFTPELEARSWDLGVMGQNCPEALLNTVFFCNGKVFCLPDLRFSQLQSCSNPEWRIYCEHDSKNHNGGM